VLRSQAHWLVAQKANARPKPAKELAYPIPRTERQCDKMREIEGEINNETPTRYIKNLAESANFKGGTFIKHYKGLIGNRFELPNVSYTHP
jgi:hypothetical protein